MHMKVFSISALFPIFLVSLLLQLATSFSPSDLEYQFRLNKLCKDNGLTFFNQPLTKTVQGNWIHAYGITAMPATPTPSHQSSYSYSSYRGKNRPAILITGAMHPREDTSFRFIQQALKQIIEQYGRNQQKVHYLFSRVVLIVIPFVNIDAIKSTFNKTQSQILNMRKNLNNDSSYQCQKFYEKGVDVNRNFDYKFATQETSSSPCSQQYHGKQPFSQAQAQSIRTIFQDFDVTTNIDVHSYGNIWIFPYASDNDTEKIKNSPLYPQYQHIFSKWDEGKVQYANCYDSLKYVADGVYIDWALEQKSVSFALQFGDNFFAIGKEMDKHIQAMREVLYINTDAFQYFLLTDEQQQSQRVEDIKLCIKSYSTISHKLTLRINNQQLKSFKQIKPNSFLCFEDNFGWLNGKQKQKQKIKYKQNLKDNYPQPQQQKQENNKIKKIQILIWSDYQLDNKNQEDGEFYIRQLSVQFISSLNKISKQSLLSQFKGQIIEQKEKQSSPVSLNYWLQIFKQFKIFFIVICTLYGIGSLCGLSIFCQKSLGIYPRAEEQSTKLDGISHDIAQQKQNEYELVQKQQSNRQIRMGTNQRLHQQNDRKWTQNK